jgi:hypothetical protein
MIDITNDALAVEGTTGCNLSCTQAFLTPDGALWPFHVVAISCIRKTKILKMKQVTILCPGLQNFQSYKLPRT